MYQAIIASYKLFIILRYVIKSNINKEKMLTRQKHPFEYRDSFLKPCKKVPRIFAPRPTTFSPLIYFASSYLRESALFFKPNKITHSHISSCD